MKAQSILIFFVVAVLSMPAFGQDISKQQVRFANKFIDAVSTNNSKKVIKMLDKGYKKEQLKILAGNKEQLINELFGGEDLTDHSIYVTIKLDEIKKIEIAEVIQLKGGEGYNYIFRVKSDRFEVHSSLRLKKRGCKYGFEGAYG